MDPPFSDLIFSARDASQTAFKGSIDRAIRVLSRVPPSDGNAFAGGSADELAGLLAGTLNKIACFLSNEVDGSDERDLTLNASAGDELLDLAVSASVPPFHPRTTAHLHTPVLIPSLKAELVLSALNQSMDSLDQSGIATLMELRLLDWLANLAGIPVKEGQPAGTFTSGGTMSNYHAVLLALHSYLQRVHGWDTRKKGLAPHLLGRLRVLSSEISHFSTEKACIQLGIGMDAVVKVPVDSEFRMDAAAAADIAAKLKSEGHEIFLIVATASTTDFGSFDPLVSLSELAKSCSAWFHVDAAYGSACLLSPTLRSNLAGLDQADSVTMDFHKAWMQSISCGALLVRDPAAFELANVRADYLNSDARNEEGIPDLVNYSLMTTRRFDALKLLVSLAEIGPKTMGEMVGRFWELAKFARRRMLERAQDGGRRGDLVPLHEPAFGCLVFRYVPRSAREVERLRVDQVNAGIPKRLFERGTAVIGHTKVKGVGEAIKFTFNNPAIPEAEVEDVLHLVANCGDEIWLEAKQ